MSISTLEELFLSSLMDIYYAEKQILKALPAMVRRADHKALKIALERRRQETEAQIARIEKAFELLGLPPRSRRCSAIDGLLSEAREHMEAIKEKRLLDADVIGLAQTVGRYEICRHGNLIAWARELGRDDIAELLQHNLDQQEKAEALLAGIARSSHDVKAA